MYVRGTLSIPYIKFWVILISKTHETRNIFQKLRSAFDHGARKPQLQNKGVACEINFFQLNYFFPSKPRNLSGLSSTEHVLTFINSGIWGVCIPLFIINTCSWSRLCQAIKQYSATRAVLSYSSPRWIIKEPYA